MTQASSNLSFRERMSFLWGEVFRFVISKGGGAARLEVRDHIRSTTTLTERELERDSRGRARWWISLGFYGIQFVKAEFLIRRGGVWSITEAGREALTSMSDLERWDLAAEKYDIWRAQQPTLDDASDVADSDENTSKRRIWMISAKAGEEGWARFRQEGVMGISFLPDSGSLSGLRREEIHSQLKSASGDANPSNNSLACFQFANEMSEGDVVIARSGRTHMYGVGIVSGPYTYDASDALFPHQRKVDWIQVHSREMPSAYVNATKALTEMTHYPNHLDVVFGRRTSGAEAALGGAGLSAADIDEFFRQEPYDLPDELESEPTDSIAVRSIHAAPSIESIDAESFLSRSEIERIVRALNSKLAIVLQGPPGTGKSFLADRLAHHHAGDRKRVLKVQFHPSYTYEDFVRGIRPDGDGGFRVENGPLAEIALAAKQRPNEPHVLLLDEINRANVAKVMGEALSLVEADKRDPRHAVQLGLACDGSKEFWLPPNLALIATMNTADRSIAQVDYAMRRRFAFFTLEPAYELQEFRVWLEDQFGASDAGAENEGAAVRRESKEASDRIVRIMSNLNRYIREHKALGPHFVLGHSFFCTYEEAHGERPLPWVERVLDTEIRPLLEEYSIEHPRVRADLLAILNG